MDEQEKRETTEAERQYSEAGKKHAEADKQYADAEQQYTDTIEASKQAGDKRREEAEQRQADEQARQQHQQQPGAAAVEQLTDATRQSLQILADRTVALGETNLRLTQNFLQNWMEQVNNLTRAPARPPKPCGIRASVSGRPSRRSLRKGPTRILSS